MAWRFHSDPAHEANAGLRRDIAVHSAGRQMPNSAFVPICTINGTSWAANSCQPMVRAATTIKTLFSNWLDLKQTDGLGLRVIENGGGQAATEHQPGIDIEAIGLHVRLTNWRMSVDDILFVRCLVFQK
jgi:hypothetical protein